MKPKGYKTKRDASREKEYKFEDLEPGTVFKWGGGTVALKLRYNKCVHLAFSNECGWFEVGNGSIERIQTVVEVYGMADEIIVKGL